MASNSSIVYSEPKETSHYLSNSTPSRDMPISSTHCKE